MPFDTPSSGPHGEEGSGVDRRRATALLVVGIVLVVAFVFMAQNSEQVTLNFLMFELNTRLWVGLLATLLLGAILGQAVEALWERRKRRRSERTV